MDLFNSIRDQAKLDSRRFGKSIVCRVVVGPLLDIAYKEGMVPKGTFINSVTGLDPINNNMLVIPVSKYAEIESLAKDYQTKLTRDETASMDLDTIETITQSRSALTSILKQNIILVTLNSNIPQGKQAGLDPQTYDVLIDSLDVNQCIEATYVYRTKSNIRRIEALNKNNDTT